MAKKPVKTFHLSAVAQSLEAQNQAIGLLIMRANTARDLCGVVDDPAKLRTLINDIAAEADKVRASIWPEDE